MEWQTELDVGNNQSATSKDENNDKPVARHHHQ